MQAELEAPGRPAAPPLRAVAPLWAVLGTLGALAWVATVDQARTTGVGPGTMGMPFPAFEWMWVAMMAAMMLPAIGLVAAGETLGAAGTRDAGRFPGVVAFGAGFLAPWAAYGALAFVPLVATGRIATAAPEAGKWIGVAVFAVAGAYQFSPWKRCALEHCRTPMHGVRGSGVRGDLAAGVRDGALCVGCCWAMMTILLAVGLMNLWAMAGLAAVVFGEKVLPRPRLVSAIAGVAFLGLAVAAAAHPSLLSGLVAPHVDAGMGMGMGMGMSAGGM